MIILSKPNPKQHLKLSNPIHLLATGFASGLAPVVPGTFGTLAGLIIWLIALQFLPLTLYWLVMIVSVFGGIYLCGKTAKDMGSHDHGSIVWDEFVGIWLVLAFIPQYSVLWIIIAFIAFRLFDMLKPWPIGWLDRRIGGGLGIMLDDIVAALFAILLMGCVYWLRLVLSLS